jgi:hypothetical protein
MAKKITRHQRHRYSIAERLVEQVLGELPDETTIEQLVDLTGIPCANLEEQLAVVTVVAAPDVPDKHKSQLVRACAHVALYVARAVRRHQKELDDAESKESKARAEVSGTSRSDKEAAASPTAADGRSGD